MLNKMTRTIIAAGLLLAVTGCTAADTLVTGWQKPPESAKPRTWWHWMNGNISKQGITRDLEAMHRVGIGGATIFQAALQEPKGPVPFFSPQWHEMMLFAAQEAKRLGIELSMHNSDGWSSSGGPWVKPADAMKMLVFSEVHVTPGSGTVKLPKPYTRMNTYGDIAVVAFPTPAVERAQISSAKLTIPGSNTPITNANMLCDGDVNTTLAIPANRPDGGSELQIQFDQPTEIRQITLQHCMGVASSITLDVSKEDGSWENLGRWNGNMSGDRPEWQGSWPIKPTTASHFRVVFNGPLGGTARLGELQLNGGARVRDINIKSLSTHSNISARREIAVVKPGSAIPIDSVKDITHYMKPDGSLDWKPASGDWTVIRFGWSLISVTNHPATAEGVGLEVDKLSYQAVTDFYKVAVGTVVKNLGPLAGSTLKHILIDSYETGPQNWTQGFEDIFKTKNKYSIISWLPALTGRFVGDDEQTERFLWDFRKTVSDRWADVYYDAFRKLCHNDNMLMESEPYGDGPLNPVLEAGLSDIPMTEYWAGSDGYGEITYQVVSGAHVTGRNIVGAEAFTGGGWEYGPFELKKLGDSQWCEGVNRYIYHTMAHQADEKLPGWTLGYFGTHFNRHNTWFNQTKSWNDYVSRSQYLLQSGHFVADVLELAEEGALDVTDNIGLPFGWRSDRIVAPFLMKATVKNGRIVMPTGMSYRLLMLPKSGRLSVSTLSKIQELVSAGATLLGLPPTETPGLEAYPKGDAQLKLIAQKVWGNSTVSKGVGQRKVGKGLVMWNMSVAQALQALKVDPDVQVIDNYNKVRYIHRRTADADIYFVCHSGQEPVQLQVAFRTAGKIPEYWYPDTGKMERATQYTSTKTTTSLPVRMDGTGSVFVVFRDKSKASAPVKAVKQNVTIKRVILPLTVLSARFGVLDDPTRYMDVTAEVTKKIVDNSLELTASNDTFGRDPAWMSAKQFSIKYKLGDEILEKTYSENNMVLIQTSGPKRDYAWVNADGAQKLTLVATEPGSYEIALANGKTRDITVKSLPTMTINTPWQVAFQPGWEAPASVVFDKLIDWSHSDDQGIKHYSGTAVYTTRFEVDQSMIGSNLDVYLNLGQVSMLAAVKINGKTLDTLWKPPFRVNVTDVVKPGSNSLEIAVTNTWVNQLIRDSQRPADQKKTWLTWQPYSSGSQLQASGLIGPVMLETEARVQL